LVPKRNRKFEIEYGYRGSFVGRAIVFLLGVGVSIGSWNALSNGIASVRGIDERTSTPAENSTLFFFAIGICVVVASLVPWPSFKDGRDEAGSQR
jgi:hypothetical protein